MSRVVLGTDVPGLELSPIRNERLAHLYIEVAGVGPDVHRVTERPDVDCARERAESISHGTEPAYWGCPLEEDPVLTANPESAWLRCRPASGIHPACEPEAFPLDLDVKQLAFLHRGGALRLGIYGDLNREVALVPVMEDLVGVGDALG